MGGALQKIGGLDWESLSQDRSNDGSVLGCSL